MVLVMDNFDSFVYNIVQYLGELGYESRTFRNDSITLSQVEYMRPSHIIVSPGPCSPSEAGISNDIIRCFGGKIPILGVCLGHQCIGQMYGGVVTRASVPTHGKSSLIFHDGRQIYRNMPNPFEGGRYHSLVVKLQARATPLIVTATTDDGVIMGIRHQSYVLEGVQFHPESIMTPVGHDLLRNFLSYREAVWLRSEACPN